MIKIFALLCGLLMMAAPVQAQTESWELMHQGDKSFRQGDFKSAEKHFDKALTMDSTNLRARFNLADTYLAQNVADSAYSNFQRVAKEARGSYPKLSSKAFHNMGVITQSTANAAQDPAQKQNYLKQAIADYKEALRLNPAANDSRYNMVLCMKQLQKNEDNQKDQQKDDSSKQKSQQKEEDKQKKEQPKPNDQQNQPKPKEEQNQNSQSKQILNYARQKEQQTKEKINVLPVKRQRGKNW